MAPHVWVRDTTTTVKTDAQTLYFRTSAMHPIKAYEKVSFEMTFKSCLLTIITLNELNSDSTIFVADICENSTELCIS